ncbi:coatomer beta C-terminal region-domain-containing protein, partial [Schizophyllum fasciatum]
SALDVVAFVREVVEKFPALRPSITKHLVSTLPNIKSGKVFRGVLWILGEYVTDVPDIQATMQEVRKVLGEIPILAAEQRALDEAAGTVEADADGEAEEGVKASTRPKVLADGTYATETAYSSAGPSSVQSTKSKPPLRALILGGDFFTGSVLAVALTKLVLRFSELSEDKDALNGLRAEAMLIMASIIRVGQSKFVTVQIDEDSNERIMQCIQTLSELEDEKAVHDIFLRDSQTAYTRMLSAQEKRAAETKAAESAKPTVVQVDDLITFSQFSKKAADDIIDVGGVSGLSSTFVADVAGFSDPIYAEAYVKMHGFDIILDVLLVNQTANTLQNLCLDFATLGDLKIVERPAVYTIGPHGFQSIKATIKVS